MGLLALLLAFTFSMSATRYETRRQLMVDEANAIGTTYLRSRMLAQPYPAQVAQLIRGYVDERFETYGSELDQQEVNVATLQSQRLEINCGPRQSAPPRQIRSRFQPDCSSVP